MRIETLTAHAAHSVDPVTGAVATPIYLSTTFERDEDGSFSRGYTYSRDNNPNRAALEACLATLEGGVAAAAFSSGMAVTNAVFQALAPGDHVVAPHDSYYGTGVLLRENFAAWGLQTTFVDMSDLSQVQEAVRPNTKLIWTETPSNPLLKITDLTRVSEIAHSAGAICVCDNTWPSPILQHPLDLGVDLVMHSTTKYLCGHSDVTGGVLITKTDNEFFQKVKKLQKLAGAIPSPFDCWLVLRGIQTLPYRVRAHSENASKVAAFLSEHRAVARVYYPGLKTHPGYEVAAKQMSMPGGMLSLEVKGGRAEAMAFTNRLQLFTRATSLGGTVSLIEHRASIEGPTTRAPESLLRVSIGLEHPDDLIEDLAQALS